MQLTVRPLSQKLGQRVVINTSFAKGKEKEMVEAAIEHRGRSVLICWTHLSMPLIGGLITGSTEVIPSAWPEHRFDVVWVFDRRSSSPGWDFQQAPQLLLLGDSAKAIV